jgi:hypothetical protein
VSDDGTGMQHDVRERVLEGVYTTKPAGIGLGLASESEERALELAADCDVALIATPLAPALRKALPRIRIIEMSSGLDGDLTKPFTDSEVALAVRNALG